MLRPTPPSYGIPMIEETSLRPLEAPAGSFAERVKILIKRVGSATEIARMCGFSEGVVRSWRDGNSDPSRARCVTLAKTLGISLIWLVAGEGLIQTGSRSAPEEQGSGEVVNPSRHRSARPQTADSFTSTTSTVTTHMDTARLNAAMQILQSQLALARSDMTLTQSSDLLAELYELLGPQDAQMDAGAMLAFQQRLSARIDQHQRRVA